MSSLHFFEGPASCVANVSALPCFYRPNAPDPDGRDLRTLLGPMEEKEYDDGSGGFGL